MKKFAKKSLALLLAVVMVACAVPMVAFAGTNGRSQSDAVNWANSKNGQSLDYDGVYGAQCVDFTAYYYQYLSAAAYVGGNANAYQTRSIPNGWSRVYYSSGITFQPGDIAVWKTNLSWQSGYSTTSTGDLGHVGIILSADSVGFNAAEQNANGKQYVTINWHYNSELYCVIRPDFVMHNPFGHIDEISGGEGYIHVSGWTMDNDDLTKSLQIHVYIGGSSATPNTMSLAIDANKSRKDVDAVYHCGEFHGFDAKIQTSLTGSQPVYIYAINIGEGGNIELGHQTVTITKHTHSYTSTVTKPATCSATGVRTYTCSCGDSYTETISKNASNHVNTQNVSAVASSCTVKGYTAGVYCNDCKKYISGHEEVPLAAHTITIINAKEATATEEGYTGDIYCTVCKQTISYGTAIPKLTEPNDPSNPTESNDSAQQQSGGCPYCGEAHGGMFGWLVLLLHTVFAALGLKK